MHYATNWQVAV